MKKVLQLTLAISIITLVGCKDDEEKINPIIGTWGLDEVTYPDPPSGYTYLTYSGNSSSLFGEVFYEIEFLADNTYKRELRYGDGSREKDNGEWELDGDNLDLIQDESSWELFFLEFTIVEEITDEEMVLLAATNSWPALTIEFVEDFNATSDTITSQASYNNIILSNAVAQPIELTLEFVKED